jgi:hypothetical protein
MQEIRSDFAKWILSDCEELRARYISVNGEQYLSKIVFYMPEFFIEILKEYYGIGSGIESASENLRIMLIEIRVGYEPGIILTASVKTPWDQSSLTMCGNYFGFDKSKKWKRRTLEDFQKWHNDQPSGTLEGEFDGFLADSTIQKYLEK